MTWCRLEDDMDENRKIRRLSADAFRLYWIAIPWCRRHQTGGRLYRDDVSELCSKHRIRKTQTALDDLLYVPYDYGVGCWSEIEPGLYEIHDFEEYNPVTSTERVRKHRSTQRVRNGAETFQGVSGNTPSRARTRAGYPDPVPEPVPVGDLSPSPTPSPPDAEDGSKDPQPTGPAEHQPLLDWWHEANGGRISPIDCRDAAGMYEQFRYLRIEEMVEVCRQQADYRASDGLATFRKLGAYYESLRRANEKRADDGFSKRDGQGRRSRSGGFSHITDTDLSAIGVEP